MILRALTILGSVLFVAFGCAARHRPTPTVDLKSGTRAPVPDGASDRGDILVWTKNDDGKATTYRLAGEGALRVLEEMPGVVIATTHGEVVWQAHEKEIELDGCDHFDGTPATPTKGTVTNVTLVSPDGTAHQDVIKPANVHETGVDEMQHAAELVGTIGPYLFVFESTYVYACGAHGNTLASALVWDAEHGKLANLLSEVPRLDALADIAKTKLDAEDGDVQESGRPELTRLVPVYGERGALRIDAQFTQWACYACSDGMWSSYTRSVLVPTEWTPDRMRSWFMPPVAVKEFLEVHRDVKLGGWSRQ